MKEKTRCEHCGALMESWWHRPSPGMVAGLTKMLQAIKIKQANDIRIGKLPGALKLTRDEHSNWTKMRFLGLVAKVKIDGKNARGRWLMTRRGFAFLRGEPIPAGVKTYRNVIQETTEEQTTIHDVMAGIKQGKPYWDTMGEIIGQAAQSEEIERAITKLKGGDTNI